MAQPSNMALEVGSLPGQFPDLSASVYLGPPPTDRLPSRLWLTGAFRGGDGRCQYNARLRTLGTRQWQHLSARCLDHCTCCALRLLGRAPRRCIGCGDLPTSSRLRLFNKDGQRPTNQALLGSAPDQTSCPGFRRACMRACVGSVLRQVSSESIRVPADLSNSSAMSRRLPTSMALNCSHRSPSITFCAGTTAVHRATKE